MFDRLYQALNSPKDIGFYSTISHWAGSIQSDQCGSFREAFELGAAAHGFMSVKARGTTRRAGEPKQLAESSSERQTGLFILEISSTNNPFTSSFDLVLIRRILLNGVLICSPRTFLFYIMLHYLSYRDLIKDAEIVSSF